MNDVVGYFCLNLFLKKRGGKSSSFFFLIDNSVVDFFEIL